MTAVINYDRSVKNLIDELSATGHVSHRAYRKTGVTFHHNAGRLSHEGVLNVWKTRPASAHFDVDRAGAVCQYVKVNEYAWACASGEGNRTTISIEMANSSTGGNWPVSETTWKSAARLAGWLFARVIGHRPSKSNIFFHHDWYATSCAGPYMDSVEDELIAEVVKAYEYFSGQSTPPRPATPDRGPRKSNTQIAAEVWAGKWGTAPERYNRLRSAGYNPDTIQALVNKGVGKPGSSAPSKRPARKSISEVAHEVIDGKWGNNPSRRTKLAKAGYNATTVQNEVNRILGAKVAKGRKSVSQLAKEVIDGKWGNGVDRKNRLTRAGYSYNQVQAEVNRRL